MATQTDSPGPRAGEGADSRVAKRRLHRTAWLIGWGIFVSTFCQTGVLGRLPFEFLLTGPLHVVPEAMAGFFALAALPWNFKPLAGLLSDSTPLFDLAVRATPEGSEAFGYSLMMSVWNIGMSLSDVFGSWLFAHYHLNFMNLVWLNAGTTALVFLVIPFLPARIVAQREEDRPPPISAPSQ